MKLSTTCQNPNPSSGAYSTVYSLVRICSLAVLFIRKLLAYNELFKPLNIGFTLLPLLPYYRMSFSEVLWRPGHILDRLHKHFHRESVNV